MQSIPTRLQARVYGLVQGVSFRYYTRESAYRLALTGWVRNQPDGSVEAVAEGPRPQLEQFLAALRQGPRLAAVERIDAAWQTATGEFTRFEIRP